MINRDVLQLAGAQFGVISRRQLTSDALARSPSAISRARRNGTLIDVTSNVYRIASSPDTFLSRCMAAQLCGGCNGFLSGFSAAHLRGLRKMPTHRIHYTVAERCRVRFPDWVEVPRSSWYDARDDRELLANGLIVANPMRMMFGLAASFNRFRFERAAEDAWHLKLITPMTLFDYLEAHRCRGKDGVRRIEMWLDKALGYNAAAQSDLERALLQELERAGLPTPVRQHPLTLAHGETIHLDISWPEIRLAVEPGASWFHGGDDQQDKDQARDRACVELGWLVVRFSETMRRDLPGAAAQIRRIRSRRIRDLSSPRNSDESSR